MTIDDLVSVDISVSRSCIIDAMTDAMYLRSTKIARWGKIVIVR